MSGRVPREGKIIKKLVQETRNQPSQRKASWPRSQDLPNHRVDVEDQDQNHGQVQAVLVQVDPAPVQTLILRVLVPIRTAEKRWWSLTIMAVVVMAVTVVVIEAEAGAVEGKGGRRTREGTEVEVEEEVEEAEEEADGTGASPEVVKRRRRREPPAALLMVSVVRLKQLACKPCCPCFYCHQ